MLKLLHLLKRNAGIAIILVLLAGGITAALVVGVKDTKKQAPRVTTAQGCGPYRKDGIMTINNHQFNVEIAYTEAAKIKGLGGRPCIQADQGMLFDFGKDGHYFIWMKDMKFPIDVIWIGSNHKVAAAEIDFKPSTYNYKKPEKSERRVNQIPARYVLEVKANTSKTLHLEIGTPVHFQKT